MPVEPSELLLSYLPVIERAVAHVSQRHGLMPAEADDLASIVKIRLIESDYAIVRAFEGRSSPATYFGIVVQRTLFDQRNKEWGKWRASAEAKRLGPVAVELERHLYRDGLTIDEAFAALRNDDEGLSRDAMEAVAKRLPPRPPRRHTVPLDEAEHTAVISSEEIDAGTTAHERRGVAGRVSELVSQWIGRLPDEDCVILQQRFGEGMTVAQIARATREDQKHLYRRIKRRLDEVRKLIESSGISSMEVVDLIGRNDTVLDFLLRKPPPRPTKDWHGETAAADSEEP